MNFSDVKNAFARQGAQVVVGTPEEFRKVVQESVREMFEVIKASGLSLQ